MPSVRATDRPIWWACKSGGDVLATGVLDEPGVLLTGVALISNVNENAFLGAVISAGGAGNYMPLPLMGTWIDAGQIYAYGGGLVIVRQSHTRTEHAPADVPALFTVYRADAGEVLIWVAGEQVHVGTRRLYESALYRALIAHQTQTDWYPSAAGVLNVLWAKVIVVPPAGPWQSGSGIYAVGDRCTYGGRLYECIQNPGVNIWTPNIVPALWRDIGAA